MYLDVWDISPDCKRFLTIEPLAADAPRKINIVLNWFEELCLMQDHHRPELV